MDASGAIEGRPVHYQSPDEILAHPAFRAARDVWVTDLLRLYENDPYLSRLLAETTRSNVFFHILTLDSVYDPNDRTTWPTLGRLQKLLGRYELSSPRRIEDLVSRLVETGYVSRQTVASDRRARLLRPTAKMLAHDVDWLRVYYAALSVMFPGDDYTHALDRDPTFRKAVRRVGYAMLGNVARMLASNPNITLFMNREAGMLVLTKLVQLGADLAPGRIVLADLANCFGISRTHIRRVLQDGRQAALLRWSDPGVMLEPPLVAAFDRFVADCLSAFDFMYHLAMNEPEMKVD